MDYETFYGMENAYPDEIATALLDEISELIDMGAIDSDLDSDNYDSIHHELTECLYEIKATAENPYNKDYWRTFYKVLSDLTEKER